MHCRITGTKLVRHFSPSRANGMGSNVHLDGRAPYVPPGLSKLVVKWKLGFIAVLHKVPESCMFVAMNTAEDGG